MNDDWTRRIRNLGPSAPPEQPNPFVQNLNSGVSHNPFGTNPAGQGNPFGAASPAYPEPYLPPAAVVSAGLMPLTVRTAYFLLVAAAAVSLVLVGLGVYAVFELRDTVDRALHLDPSGTANAVVGGYVDDVQLWLASATIGFGLVCALLYAVIGRAVRKGRRWPRPVGAALAVLSLPALFFGPWGVAMVLLGIAAMVAVWTPSAREFSRLTSSGRLRT